MESPNGRTQFGMVWVALILGGVAGCAEVTIREPIVRNAFHGYQERREAARPPQVQIASALDRAGLTELAEHDPAAAAGRLETKLSGQPTAEGAVVLAELSYRSGMEQQSRQPLRAIAWFRDAAALASLSLRESGSSHTDLAIQIHNRSVTRLIRIAQAEAKRTGGEWRQVVEGQGLTLASPSPDLAPDRFADLQIIDDVQVEGMQHLYRTQGFGVPPSGPSSG